MNRLASRATVAACTASLVLISGCSSEGNSAATTSAADSPTSNSQPADDASQAPDSDSKPSADVESDATVDTETAAGEEAPSDDPAAPAAGASGAVCDVLVKLYDDIMTLPQRVEDTGVSEEDIDRIMGPAEAIKDDLPSPAGTVLPILRNDVRAASVLSSAADVEEYFQRGTHDIAIESLVTGAQKVCDLPADWPEGA